MHPTPPRRRSWPTVVLLVVTALLVALAAVVLVAPPAGATSQLRPGGLVELIGQARRAPGPSSPPPWLAGAALLAMAVVAACRPGTLDHPDPPGGP
jgi:hypothetical protein